MNDKIPRLKDLSDGLFRFGRVYINIEKIEHRAIGIFFCIECESLELTIFKYKLSVLW